MLVKKNNIKDEIQDTAILKFKTTICKSLDCKVVRIVFTLLKRC